MRFKLSTPAKEAGFGKKRVKTKFLFLPKKINNEIRWLEKTAWIQKVDFKIKFKDFTHYKIYYWGDIEWLDKYGMEKGEDEWLED